MAQLIDLLNADPLREASETAGWPGLFSGVRASWAAPLEQETSAPRARIIHSRVTGFDAPGRLHRLGLRRAQGYVKCGSRTHVDWPTAFRLLVWDGAQWSTLRDERNLVSPAGDLPLWFDLGGHPARAAIIELRCCAIDRWWTSWNLAAGSLLLEGETESPPRRRSERRLSIDGIDLSGLPPGVKAEQLPGEVRFTTPRLEVGFSAGRAGFSYLGIDESAGGQTSRNLLRGSPAVAIQGPRFWPVGAPPLIAPLLHNEVRGSFSVTGNTVSYTFSVEGAGQHCTMVWEVQEDSLLFRITRRGDRAVRVWDGSAWTVALDSRVTPATVPGKTLRHGESGLLMFPALLHAPGHGTLRLTLSGGDALLRSDSHRPLSFTTLAVRVGEIPQPEGDYLLPAGEFHAEGACEVFRPAIRLRPSAPPAVIGAVERCSITSMTYRADTATLSNNGNSMHAPLCMDTWSSLAVRLQDFLPMLRPDDLLRDTLERWLDGGPGYASGGLTGEHGIGLAEDEYVMTGAAALLGLAEYLQYFGTAEWVSAFAPQIRRQISLMRARDVDDDGLVESRSRDGISGGHQWSSNWYDVISFGWKDAFSNALLYRALVLLARELPRLGGASLSSGLEQWATRLQSNYCPAFFNDATGWLAGWRSKDNVLHDYAFLAVNGAAVLSGVVTGERALGIIQSLWREARRAGMPDPRLGLPGNLRPVPDDDMIELMHGKPMGYYINGGLTHSQSSRFVGALYAVGMAEEADGVLERLCGSLADATAFGGSGSGIDWRYWDGAPCGYEGILTDQFGILAVAIDRYGPLRRS